MITFAEKRKEFLKNMRAKYREEDSEVLIKSNSANDDDVDADLMALLEKKFDELLGGLIEKPQGKPVLVPLSDKRQPMNTAQNDFKD